MTKHNKPAVFYGIGVGPGDPDLLTIKAARILGEVDVIFAAASDKNNYSLACEIAKQHFSSSAEVVTLYFPMHNREEELKKAWQQNAAAVEATLLAGKSAAFITLGDPLIYSTFGYLYQTLKFKMPSLKAEIVPGITSFQAAAAKVGEVLCEAEETLLLIPGTSIKNGNSLPASDNAIILKAYKNMPEIKLAAEKSHSGKRAFFVSNLGLAGEEVKASLADAPDNPGYLSLMLLLKDRQ